MATIKARLGALEAKHGHRSGGRDVHSMSDIELMTIAGGRRGVVLSDDDLLAIAMGSKSSETVEVRNGNRT